MLLGRQPCAPSTSGSSVSWTSHCPPHRRSAEQQRCACAPQPAVASSAQQAGPQESHSYPATRPRPAPVRLHQLEPQLSGRDIEARALHLAVDWTQQHPRGVQVPVQWPAGAMEDAYARCGVITKDYAKTFYLGTKLMTPAKAKAIWAIYVWCRRTDELVDGPNASRMTPAALDQWEERLEAVFEGRPYDILDAALTATVAEFPVSIQPFRDMIDGMRMDLVKSRYNTFDELYEYCYKVAGTVGLMTGPVMGTDPTYKGPLDHVYKAALSLGVANQLTNILRDVGEDSQERNRLYLPLDELDEFGMSEQEVLRGMFCRHTGAIDDRWVRFMKFQITRARKYFADAYEGVNLLDQDARWPVWSALILYRQILDAIEKNGYDNFNQRAYVRKWRKYASLPAALAKARFG